MEARHMKFVQFGIVLGAAWLLSGCGSDDNDRLVFEGDFPIAFVQRDASAPTDPLDPIAFTPGGDLYIKDLASPRAKRTNVTGGYTRGRGDVAGPQASFDGTRLVFSMRGPDDPTWNIWEYELDSGSLRRLIADDAVANAGDDLSPHYLADGSIVFASNRQQGSRQKLLEEGIEPYLHLDEYQRQAASVLHVMSADGGDIRQISFNLSHDRTPAVLSDGRIVYSRWNNLGAPNHSPLYVSNADGTGMEVLYGSFSPGNSFLYPREMPDGRLIAAVAPFTGGRSGGALMVIDSGNYTDNERPTATAADIGPGQRQASRYEIPLEGPSAPGRFTAPYPVWDRNNQVLVAYTPYQPAVGRHPLSEEVRAAEADPAYGIYVVDLEQRSQRPIALPQRGHILTEPVALMPRPLPASSPLPPRDAALAAEPNGVGGTGMGVLSIASVYDTDVMDLLGDDILLTGETIPRLDARPDLALLADPARSTADPARAAADPSLVLRPARFLRVSRALPMPPGLPRALIGNNSMPMQQILGYAQIEPDGSVHVRVPADTPLMLAVVDAYGRTLHRYPGWHQVRPGETNTCSGCRAPGRSEAANRDKAPGPWDNAVGHFSANAGETMAETRTRVGPQGRTTELDASALLPDLYYQDVWTDPSAAGRAADDDHIITYFEGPGGRLKPEIEVRQGIINYPEHIQYGLWERSRSGFRCADCHAGTSPAAGLDLSRRLVGGGEASYEELQAGITGRLVSYDALTLGAPILDEEGLPQVEIRDGQVVIRRHPPLIEVGELDQGARTSRLIERLFGERLRSSHDTPAEGEDLAPYHTLEPAELRLLAEWIDLGAQYYNDPFENDAALDGARTPAELRGAVHDLDEAVFAEQVHPILMNQCAACHSVTGNEPTLPGMRDSSLSRAVNAFRLSGRAAGDFNSARAMISNLCSPEASALLSRPAGVDPNGRAHLDADGVPILAAGEPDYLTILNWVADAAALSCSDEDD